MARGRTREDKESTVKTYVFEVRGYIQIEIDSDDLDEGEDPVSYAEDVLKGELEDVGEYNSFQGDLIYCPGKKIRKTTTVELVDE